MNAPLSRTSSPCDAGDCPLPQTALDYSQPPPTNHYDHPMSLASTAQRAHETVRGVKFAMLDGPTLVAVPVALQKHRVVAAGIGRPSRALRAK
jgi:hypothetical protein